MARPGAGTAVRTATADDIDAIVAVVWEVASEGRWLGTEVPFDRDQRRLRWAELIARPDSLVLVADGTGAGGPEVVGQLASTVAPYGVADLGMAILAGWRGRGLGAALLGSAITWAAGAGAHKMALEVWPGNQAAIALYRNSGFVEEGMRRRHYRRANGELWTSVLMGLALDGPSWPVRPARDDDGWDLVGLVAACWSEYPGCVMDPHGEVPELLAPATAYRAKNGIVWVVEGPGGGVIASVAVATTAPPAGPPTAEVQKLYVGRGWRRRGLARFLVAMAEEEARRRGAERVEAWSDTRFTGAHRFYVAHGYRRTGATRELGDRSDTVEAHFVKDLTRGPRPRVTADRGTPWLLAPGAGV